MHASDNETRLRKHREARESIKEQAEQQLESGPTIAVAEERLNTSAVLQMMLDLNNNQTKNTTGRERRMRAKAKKAAAAVAKKEQRQ